MGLALGVTEGSVVYIDGQKLKVTYVAEDVSIIGVSINGMEYSLTPDFSVEVYPQVFVSIGTPSKKRVHPLPRLYFEAPRHIEINRENYGHRKTV
jgi:hypothetical protein